MKNIRKSVLINFIWRVLEKMGTQIITLAVSVILARILTPEDYGIIALISIFISILTVFVDSGLGTALIQKKEVDETDFSSVFFGQIVLCIVFYVILFFAAPLVASLFHKPEMTVMIRVLGISLIVAGIKNIQVAYVSRNMIFRKFFVATLGGTVFAAGIAIWLAERGSGPWSLIAFHLFNNTIDTIILWIIVKWRPKMHFSFKRLKILFSFGWKLMVSSALDTIFSKVQGLLIGKLYTETDLGYYDQGNRWPNAVTENVNFSIDSILLPTMSTEQEHIDRVKLMTKRAIMAGMFVMAPLLSWMAFCGKPFFRLLLTEKWGSMYPFLFVFSMGYILYPIHTANLNAIKAVGRSDLFLILELIKKGIGIVLLFITIPISPMAICIASLVLSIISVFVNIWPNRKLIGYGIGEQFKDVLPVLALALASGGCVYWIQYLPFKDWLVVLIQLFAGFGIYLLGAKFFKLEAFRYTMVLLKDFVRKEDEA